MDFFDDTCNKEANVEKLQQIYDEIYSTHTKIERPSSVPIIKEDCSIEFQSFLFKNTSTWEAVLSKFDHDTIYRALDYVCLINKKFNNEVNLCNSYDIDILFEVIGVPYGRKWSTAGLDCLMLLDEFWFYGGTLAGSYFNQILSTGINDYNHRGTVINLIYDFVRASNDSMKYNVHLEQDARGCLLNAAHECGRMLDSAETRSAVMYLSKLWKYGKTLTEIYNKKSVNVAHDFVVIDSNSVCSCCGCYENSASTDCCGRRLREEEITNIVNGVEDYVDGKWITRAVENNTESIEESSSAISTVTYNNSRPVNKFVDTLSKFFKK